MNTHRVKSRNGRTRHFGQRGVSLIEALVAFGVMAFGMMAVVGMQATLRGSGDLARQRSEAVRIAQDAVEAWRGFTTLTTLPATNERMAFDNIASAGSIDVPGDNATYRLVRQVNPEPAVAGTSAARRLTLVVDVSWDDRAGRAQLVRLASTITADEPELAGSMVLAGMTDPLFRPRGRQQGIPAGAVALYGQPGRSGFVPPGQPIPGPGGARVAWVFNNSTGVITLCSTTFVTSTELQGSGNAPACGTSQALLLTGSVRYTGADLSTLPQSVVDPDGVGFPPFGVLATQTFPGGSSTIADCYLDDAVSDSQRSYFCAMRISPAFPDWNGGLAFTAPLAISSNLSDSSPSRYKICRYHALATYANITSTLPNQNYVIIKAGNGSSVFECPPSTTPRTWAHQPVS